MSFNALSDGNFYPRPPRGGRQWAVGAPAGYTGFLSTPSARRATKQVVHRVTVHKISIHALREEGDGWHGLCYAALSDFYPRPPRGGRLSVIDASI